MAEEERSTEEALLEDLVGEIPQEEEEEDYGEETSESTEEPIRASEGAEEEETREEGPEEEELGAGAAADSAGEGGGDKIAPTAAERKKWQERLEAKEKEFADREAAYHAQLQKYDGLAQELGAWRKEREDRRKADEAAKNVQEVPAFDEDPQAHIQAKFSQYEQELSRLREENQNLSNNSSQRDQQHQLVSAIRSHESQFMGERPDYYEALNHVRAQDMANLMAQGLDQPQAANELMRQELITSHRLIQRGANVAEHFYNLAGARGYKGPGDGASDSGAKTSGNGAADPASTDEIAAARERQKAGSMGSNSTDLSKLDDWDDVEEDEFDEAMSQFFGGEANYPGRPPKR
jgi:hypothetical protein